MLISKATIQRQKIEIQKFTKFSILFISYEGKTDSLIQIQTMLTNIGVEKVN